MSSQKSLIKQDQASDNTLLPNLTRSARSGSSGGAKAMKQAIQIQATRALGGEGSATSKCSVPGNPKGFGRLFSSIIELFVVLFVIDNIKHEGDYLYFCFIIS